MTRLPLVIVHGGAGDWKNERIPVGLEYVKGAAEIGFSTLLAGGTALDAAEACTQFMESCGELNAGRGARPNSDGVIELDAMIVDGKNLDFGSVAGVTDIVNPISLARYIMEKTKHKFFVGPNAKRVYDEMIKVGYRKEYETGVVKPHYDTPEGDTVGCIVVDVDGNIVATSSTGGIPKKVPGRVGDSPVMGSGAFANEIGGASATGWGEHIMRVVLSRMVVLYVEEGANPMEAAKKGMKMFSEKTGSEAGIIVVDKDGNTGYATNAKAMPVALIQGSTDNTTITICEK
ncbi:peptidase T [Candidatus Thorarchaeota archaeon]|nr:MAG: peptidase T [Candidatus Thorarchaeota archaeon]